MNEFVSHVFKSIDSHEAMIRKLAKSNRKNVLVLAFLTGVIMYQSSKMSDLKFEVDRLDSRVRDLEENPNVVNNVYSE